jgi:hypothetical protein
MNAQLRGTPVSSIVVVSNEVGRRKGPAARGEIARTCAGDHPHGPDAGRDQAAIGERADADRHIDAVLDQIENAIRQQKTQTDFRIRLLELTRERQEVEVPDAPRRGDRHAAGRRAIFAGRFPLGVVDLLEDSFARLDISPPGVGERQAPGGAVKKLRPQPRL